MKRIYACIGIVALLFALAYSSSLRVEHFAQEITATLSEAEDALRTGDDPAARQALAEGAALCEEMHRAMHAVLRTEDFIELEASLRAADGYLELGSAEEALGEVRRAQVGAQQLERLSRRLL